MKYSNGVVIRKNGIVEAGVFRWTWAGCGSWGPASYEFPRHLWDMAIAIDGLEYV